MDRSCCCWWWWWRVRVSIAHSRRQFDSHQESLRNLRFFLRTLRTEKTRGAAPDRTVLTTSPLNLSTCLEELFTVSVGLRGGEVETWVCAQAVQWDPRATSTAMMLLRKARNVPHKPPRRKLCTLLNTRNMTWSTTANSGTPHK